MFHKVNFAFQTLILTICVSISIGTTNVSPGTSNVSRYSSNPNDAHQNLDPNCQRLPIYTNAVIVCMLPNMCKVTCARGYDADGDGDGSDISQNSMDIICGDNGEWSGNLNFNCQETVCSVPPTIYDADVDCEVYSGNERTCTLKCKDEKENVKGDKNGETTVTCKGKGPWVKTTDFKCEEPAGISFAIWTGVAIGVIFVATCLVLNSGKHMRMFTTLPDFGSGSSTLHRSANSRRERETKKWRTNSSKPSTHKGNHQDSSVATLELGGTNTSIERGISNPLTSAGLETDYDLRGASRDVKL